MASQTSIVNRALIKLGANPIRSLSDSGKSAETMAALWDETLRAELSRRYWNFAIARTQLAALATAPEWGFPYQYQLPSDFLKPVQISDTYVAYGLADYRTGDDSPYAIEGGNLLTIFGPPLSIRYVRYVTDTGLFHPLFCEALSAKLAYDGCYAITQSNTCREAALNDYKLALREASAANAVAKPPQGLPDDSWMLGRL